MLVVAHAEDLPRAVRNVRLAMIADIPTTARGHVADGEEGDVQIDVGTLTSGGAGPERADDLIQPGVDPPHLRVEILVSSPLPRADRRPHRSTRRRRAPSSLPRQRLVDPTARVENAGRTTVAELSSPAAARHRRSWTAPRGRAPLRSVTRESVRS